MTAGRLASTGRNWLGSATMPRAASTAVIPISKGRPAATGVPKAMGRTISVSGSGGIDPMVRLRRIPGDLEVHQAGVAVGGDRSGAGQRRPDVLDVWDLREAARHVLDGGPERRVLHGQLVALDEHGLLARPQTGAIERHLGPVGLTREVVDVGDLRRADHVAGHEHDDDERQPAPERLLAVPATPDRHAGRQVVLRRRGGHEWLLTLAFGADPHASTPVGGQMWEPENRGRRMI